MNNNLSNENIRNIIEWVAVIVLLYAFWPVGLYLLFKKLKKIPSNKQKTNNYTQYKPNANPYSYKAPFSEEPKPQQPKPQKKNKPKASGALALLLLGIVLAIISVVNLFEAIDYSDLYDLAQGLFYGAGSAAAFIARGFVSRRSRRFAKYMTVMGLDDAKSVSEIADATGVKPKTIRKDLEYMAERGYFGPDAYFDIGLDSIVISQEAAENERSARYAREHKPEKEESKASQYMQILERFRRLNSTITDGVISGKVARIEELAGKIFKIVEEDPSKEKEIKKFTEYYLPSTEKLLRTYSVLERQGVSGNNITTAKSEIERILDTLIEGYEHQLDRLFNIDALDISSDIDVLENMLKQDGLTSDGFRTMGGN